MSVITKALEVGQNVEVWCSQYGWRFGVISSLNTVTQRALVKFEFDEAKEYSFKNIDNSAHN